MNALRSARKMSESENYPELNYIMKLRNVKESEQTSTEFQELQGTK